MKSRSSFQAQIIRFLSSAIPLVVSVAGHVVADTRNALTLREAAYPPIQYIPGEDVDFSQLERTDHVTYCPYKGPRPYQSPHTLTGYNRVRKMKRTASHAFE